MAEFTKITSYRDIKGWFAWDDRMMFDALLASQDDSEPGVLVELGAYLGRSAVIIGDHQRPGEQFVVIDLFGSEEELHEQGSADEANRRENRHSYRTLTRMEFESNYLSLHAELPTVVQGLSSTVTEHVRPGSARFVHIDASHVYLHVAADIANVKQLLRPDGVVVLDDYRSAHTPGVAAAAWEAVLRDGLVPFAITAHKMYGVWGDPTPYQQAVRDLVADDKRWLMDSHPVLDHTIMRLRVKPAKKPEPVPPGRSSADSPTSPSRSGQLDPAAARTSGNTMRHKVANRTRRAAAKLPPAVVRLARKWRRPKQAQLP